MGRFQLISGGPCAPSRLRHYGRRAPFLLILPFFLCLLSFGRVMPSMPNVASFSTQKECGWLRMDIDEVFQFVFNYKLKSSEVLPTILIFSSGYRISICFSQIEANEDSQAKYYFKTVSEGEPAKSHYQILNIDREEAYIWQRPDHDNTDMRLFVSKIPWLLLLLNRIFLKLKNSIMVAQRAFPIRWDISQQKNVLSWKPFWVSKSSGLASHKGHTVSIPSNGTKYEKYHVETEKKMSLP